MTRRGDAPADRVAVARQVADLVSERFFDARRAAEWRDRHRDLPEKAAAAGSREVFADAVRRALSDLGASHTAYHTPDDPEYYGLTAIFRGPLGLAKVETDSIGADVTPEGFVRAVFAGGPAQRAGLRRGDRIVSADGAPGPFHPVRSLRGRAGRPLAITVRRSATGPEDTLRVTPRRADPQDEWLAAQRAGTRVLNVSGRRVGYLPMFCGAGERYEAAAREAVAGGELQQARALVLDLRDGWGGMNPSFVTLFDPRPPVLSFRGREGGAWTELDAQWRRPLIVLVNGGTRSGKEAVAHALRKHRVATLVGSRTAGAVLGGQCFLLRDRSLLYLAVRDVRVDGTTLEGVGVAPDIAVPDALEYSGGKDAPLEKALRIAAERSE